MDVVREGAVSLKRAIRPPNLYGKIFVRINHKKIATANMTYKVIRVAILAHHALADLSDQANHIIAPEESIDIIKRLKVVKVEVEHAPWLYAIQLILDG